MSEQLQDAHAHLAALMLQHGHGTTVYPEADKKAGRFFWVAYHRGWKKDCDSFIDAVWTLTARVQPAETRKKVAP